LRESRGDRNKYRGNPVGWKKYLRVPAGMKYETLDVNDSYVGTIAYKIQRASNTAAIMVADVI